jgi:hypothetical protein
VEGVGWAEAAAVVARARAEVVKEEAVEVEGWAEAEETEAVSVAAKMVAASAVDKKVSAVRAVAVPVVTARVAVA